MVDRPAPRRAALALALVSCCVVLPTGASAQTSSSAERRAVDRAERLRQSGRPDEARATLGDLLEEEPASVDALVLLRELLVEAEDPAAILPFVESALGAGPTDRDAVRELWVGSLIGAGLADSARTVAERWVSEAPGDERAVLAVAIAHLARADTSRAIDRLKGAATRGLSTLPLDMLRADLLVATGEIDEAADAWVALLGGEVPAIDEVEADLWSAPDPAAALARLLGRLQAPGTSIAAGALVALRLGDATAARSLADGIAGNGRPEFLRDYVREADLAGVPAEVAWAATELVLLSPRPVDKMRWRAMAAERSLAAGDTANARESFRALASETQAGDGPHDAASRRLFDLLAADPERLEEARTAFEHYRQEYPDSGRVHGAMAGGLAEGHARAGDLDPAEAIVAIERARLPEAAGAALDAAAGRIAFWAGARDSAIVRIGRSLSEAGLGAGERTDRLRLLTMLSAGDSTEIRAAGRIAFGLHREPATYDASGALRSLGEASRSPGRPTVLSYLGDLVWEAGQREVAGTLRRRIIEEFPRSPEAPAAILALARASAAAGAREWLERLVVGYPESALAPVARRLLSEMDEGGSGG